MNLRNLFRRRKPEPEVRELVDVLIADNASAISKARAIREGAEINRELAAEHPEWTAFRRRQLLRSWR